MSGDISNVSPESSPTLTDLSTDFASTSAALPKMYHITEPWDDPSAPPSEPVTPRSGPAADVEHPPLCEVPEQEAKEDAEPVIAASSQPEGDEAREQPSPGAESTQSGSSSVDKIIREANLLVSEMHEKDRLDQMESSNNTTYRDLPGAAAMPAEEVHGDATLEDREVEILNADSVASKSSSAKQTPRRGADESEMDSDVAGKVKSLMSETGWRDRRIKSFDYAALKQDLEDIENRLQRARDSTSTASLWPDQRKAQSLQFLMGAPHSPVDRNQSPDTLTSSGKASSLAELDRSRRLKWDYAADIASGRDPATPVTGLGGSGELSGSGEARLRMSMSQASFVSSPDPEDSAVEAAIKTRDLAVLKDSKAPGGLSARMEDILGRGDPQSHVAAILQQADEAERRLRARLRKAPEEGGPSYLEALRDDGAWNRLNLGSGAPTSGLRAAGAAGATDSARSNTTTSGEQRLGASARSNTTMESTHPGSDDAMGPSFPDGVYGSRADPHYSPRGIYFKPKTKDGKAGPQFKSPGMPQRSRTGPRAVVEEAGHRARPPVSPSAGFGDVHKSLETISSHDTGASTAVAARTPDLEPHSLEEYATKLRNKWERYQRLLGQGRGSDERPTTPRELQELLRNPSRYATSAAAKKTPREAWTEAPKQRASVRSGRGEKVGSGGDGPGRQKDGVGRSRGVQAGKGGANRTTWGGGGGDGGGSEDEGDERWRRGGYEESGDEDTERTDSQDTMNLMTRMAGLLRNEYDEEEEEEGPPSLGLTEDEQLSEGTFSELDPQLLRLKHLFLKQKEKWLWERARETTRRHKIQKLQRLIAERARRHRVVNIDDSLDTATLSSSILSDLEDSAAPSPGERRHRSSAPSQSSDGTVTEPAPPPKPKRREEKARKSKRREEKPRKSPKRREEQAAVRAKPAIIKQKRNRQVQDEGNAKQQLTWEIAAPGRRGNKENWCPNMPARRPKPNTAFVEKLTEVAARDHNGVAASGGGLSWYHPATDRTTSSKATGEDSLPGTSRSGRHADVGVQGGSEAPSLSVPSDGLHIQEKLAQPLLTQAFEGRMAAFISRSRERQKRVRLAAEERRYVAEMERERVRLFAGDEAGKRRPRTQPDPLSENLHQPQRRAFTRKEMREQNKRMCRALPEQQQRAQEEKKKAQTRSNVIRRQLYGEKVLRSVLRKRGPWVVTF